MRILIYIWIVVTLFLGTEYWLLHFKPQYSQLLLLQKYGYISPKFLVTHEAGRSLSLWLGWVGLGLMVIMNVYSIRKRTSFMNGIGALRNWLNFHIFCGLLGPSFILFHSDFKVRGLVAISFWSMVVSFTSGIVGRYLFVNLLTSQKDLELFETKLLRKLDQIFDNAKIAVDATEKDNFLSGARKLAGVPDNFDEINPFGAFFNALAGSLRMQFKEVAIGRGWPPSTRYVIEVYADTRRKISYAKPFAILLGYWHTFHFPFAVFMYVAAAIHVASALVFGV